MTLPLFSDSPINYSQQSPILPEEIFVFPVSFAQSRLWFLNRLEPDNPAYNIPYAIRLEGNLNLTALEQSFKEIIRRHEVLRTTFAIIDGETIQAIAPSLSLKLNVIDSKTSLEADQESEIEQLILAEAWQPFDLEKGPLLRVTLLCITPTTHILILTIHHIIADAWSLEIFIREIAILYEAFEKGKPSPLQELPIQYADFAVWQRQWLQGKVLETQLNYWTEKLPKVPPILSVPTDFPRSTGQTFVGARRSLELSQTLTQSLKALSCQEGTTLFMTMLAAFKVLLYRYTSQTDILVGTPIANRNRKEIEPLIGFFVNTLVIKSDLQGNPTFRQLLAAVRQVALEAYAHQDLPFEKLVEHLQPERSLSYSPLFQVMFVFQNASKKILHLPNLTLTPIEIKNETAKFDLTLSVQETEENLVCTLKYRSELFKSETIARMLDHWQILLEEAIANRDRGIAELPLLRGTQREQLLYNWNDTKVDYSENLCLHQWFEASVRRSPHAIATVFETQYLTYQDLNQRANQLAHYLQKLGIKPGSLVGICLDRCLEMPIAILAVLKAGGAYIPLDPTYPEQRLAFVLQDSQVSTLITTQKLLNILPQCQAQIVCLDTHRAKIEQQSQENPTSKGVLEDLAYVIYTSGSTGKPKGVMISHRAINNRLLWGQSEYPLTQSDRVLQQASFSFDFSVWEFFAPWLAGGQVILVPPGQHRDSSYLVKLIQEQKITVAHFVPSMLRAILEEPGIQGCQSLRYVFSGGESLAYDLQQCFFSRLSAELYNQYGPTEATVDATFWKCQRNDEPSLIPIGRPIANTQVYILDFNKQPVPIGVPGELWIGGVGLAQGYLNRPDLTAERFLVNPFCAGGQIYRTGDLARYRSDGAIEFLGRIDSQVKVRGFRIELEEIEAIIRQHPNVKETVVLAREDIPGRQRLVAYVVINEDKGLDKGDLVNLMGENLPDYMIPSDFVALSALPLTPSGKIDRLALPAPDSRETEEQKTFVCPRTPVEVRLAQIWAEVLQVEKVSIDDNFFALGGDSILCLQVVAKANQVGLQLRLKQIFEYQTIADLASFVGTAKMTIAPQQGVVTGPVELTPIQHRFFEQNFVQMHHWNQAVMLEPSQELNRQYLEEVVQGLLKHHDALRLRFIPSLSAWKAVNGGHELTTPVLVIDLSMLPTSEQIPAMEREAEKLQASLNLSTGPLVRVVLFELGGRAQRLLIIIHHLVVDGVSWRILLEDFQTAYMQLSQGKALELPPKTTSFQQWAEELTKYAQSAKVDSERDYWVKQFNDQTPCLFLDPVAADNTVAQSHNISVELNQEETHALLQVVPDAYQTQIQEVLLTALVQAFALVVGQRSLVIDLEGHGREDILEGVDLSRTVGWFTTIFPVKLTLGFEDDPGVAIKTIKEQLRTIPNRGIGYGILRYLKQDKAIVALPQARVKFNYLGQFDQVLSGSSLLRPAFESTGSARSLQSTRSHPLEINGAINRGQLRLTWTFSLNINQQKTIEKLAQCYLSQLRSLIAHCQSSEAGGYTPCDFPQMDFTQEELEQFLTEFE
ncbi:non-ribosomal peptide synthetase [Gloeothece citriformis]|nr:non-ribosomal peptide synthetase [Gloeothece citriformis]